MLASASSVSKRALLIGHLNEEPLQSVKTGLERLSFDVHWVSHADWTSQTTADLVVIYGLRAWGPDIVHHYESCGVPVVVVDLGYIRRAHVAADLVTGFLYVGIGGLGRIPPMAPGDRAKALGIEANPARQGPIRKALICGQVELDASHALTAPELVRTYHDMAQTLERQGVETWFRPHPFAKFDAGLPIAENGPIADVVRQFDLVASINSNAGLDALLEGLPVMICKPCHYQSLAWPENMPVIKIHAPTTKQVQNLINRLSYAQWTAAEIAEGLPFVFMQAEGLI